MKIPEVINFKVKPGRDDDIINWLEGLGDNERSFYIRLALREWLQGKSKGGRVQVRLPVKRSSDDKEPELSEEELNKRLDCLDF